MTSETFPFPAVVGQEELKQALLMLAVDPTLSGLLIKGPRGTAKSTLVRGLSDLLPSQPVREDCPYRCHPDRPPESCPFCSTRSDHAIVREAPPVVTLPLGATRDTVLGSLSLEDAVREGERRFDPGLIARAHRGFLYVDEVNLLPDPLVDVLLDVAASGVHRVAREGLSVEHPADFQLIGSMNPAEGSLRPQLLDRFGLGVTSETLSDPDRRRTLSRRVERYDREPNSLLDEFASERKTLRDRIEAARTRREDLSLDETQESWLINRAMEHDVEGHRADIYLRKAALTRAALQDRDEVVQEDLEAVVPLVLNHRTSTADGTSSSPSEPEPSRDQDPFDDGSDLASSGRGNGKEDGEPSDPPGEDAPYSDRPDPRRRSQSPTGSPAENPAPETPDEPSPPATPDRPDRPELEPRPREDLHGPARFDPTATLRQSLKTDHVPPLSIRADHLRFRSPETVPKRLIVGVLDLSGSMLKNRQLGFLKRSLLQRARSRSGEMRQFALFAVRDRGLHRLLSPTRRTNRLRRILHELEAGGPTPMEPALSRYAGWLESWTTNHPRWPVTTWLYTDGRFPRTPGLSTRLRQIRSRSVLEHPNPDP